MNIMHKKLLYILPVVIFIYPFFLIWQGGDLTDSGYHIWHYKYFFNNLLKGETNSSFFLTNFLGALWYKTFSNGTIISFRILFSFFTVGIAFLTFKILNEKTDNKIILLFGILCGISFGIRYSSIFFSYDIASIFFLFLMSYLLIKYFELKKVEYLFVSGMVLFLSFITRLPNLVFLIFLPIIFFYHYFYNMKTESFFYFKIKKVIIDYTIFCFGFFLFCGIFYGFLRSYDIFNIYLENFNILKIDVGSSYSFSNLLMSYYRDLISFFPHFILVNFIILLISILYDSAKSEKTKLLFFLLPLILLFLAVIIIYGTEFSYKSNIKYLIPAFCSLPLLLSIVWKDKYSTSSLVLILVAITQVLGSNTGIFLKLSYGFIALIPLSLIILYENRVVHFGNIKISTKSIYVVGIFFILFFSLWSTFGTLYHVDKGLRSRIRSIYPIEHEKMKGIFTTKTNARYIKILTTSIRDNIKKNNTLFIYGNIPMLYYLTEKEPSIRQIWLANNRIKVDKLFSDLEASIVHKKKYPMIIDTKHNIMGKDGQKKLDTFLKKYNFYIVDDNQFYAVWKTHNSLNHND